MDCRQLTYAVIGGTGALGGGLARRMARCGFRVLVGSREAGKARAFAEGVGRELPAGSPALEGMGNAQAASAADVVIVTVPFASQTETLDAIADAVRGKIVIDTSVCLQPPKVGTVQIPAAGSACQQSQARLGREVRVVGAFQNISAEHLQDPAYADCDVLVCGDDEAARLAVVDLVERLGLRAWQAGPLANSVAIEGMTSVLIGINRRYRIPGGAGLRISGHG